MSDDTEDYIRFQMVWPARLARKVAGAARTRTISRAAWLREAALEKLERDG